MPLSEDLLPRAIQRRLQTRWLARRAYFLRELDSTNRVAADLARDGEPHGSLVVADYQTRGRGRWDRTWESAAGSNILASVILRPEIDASAALPVTLAFSAAIAETLEAITGRETGVKWPNDVVVEGRKICGMLSEGVSRGQVAVFIVVGMGINVNAAPEEFPAEIRDGSCSCYSLTGRRWDRGEVLARVLSALEPVYNEFVREGFVKIVPRYASRLVVLGKPVRFVKSGVATAGTVVEVAHDGSLVVDTANGRMALREQDVSLLREGGTRHDPRC